jgi:hypothetical protein
LLQFQPRHRWLEASVDEQLFYTDNVFLSDTQRKSANVLVSTLAATLTPPSTEWNGGLLAPRVGYQHQWFNYGLLGDSDYVTASFIPTSIATNKLSAFDFNVQTIFADAAWSRGDWDFSFGMDYRRFLDSSSYDEFYREIVPRLAVHYTFHLDENKAIALGYEGDYRTTRTINELPGNTDDYNNRTDHALVLVGIWRLGQHAIVQPFDRLQYSYFTHNHPGRTDWQNTAGIALTMPITDYVVFRIFTSYDTLSTDGAFVRSYDKFDIGGGLNLSARF